MIPFRPTPFEVARENLRQTIEYMRYEIKISADVVRLQLDVIMRSLEMRDQLEGPAPGVEK